MTRARVRFSYRDYLLLPEDKRYEILDGELFVVPAPNTRHQRISKRLEAALIHHVEGSGIGEVFHAPYDVILSDENIVQPDILVVRKDRSALVGELNLQGAPDIAVEILSPGTRNKDLELKRKIYAAFGIREYWIVDPDADTIEVLVLHEGQYARAVVFGRFDRLSSPLLPDLNLPLGPVLEE
jgi:Uma2 family endonuclease